MHSDFPSPAEGGGRVCDVAPLWMVVMRARSESKAISATRGCVWLKLAFSRSEEHTSELQSHVNLVCRLLLAKTITSERHKHIGQRLPRAASPRREPRVT